MKLLPVAGSAPAQVDDEDFYACQGMMPWHLNGQGYVRAYLKGVRPQKYIYLTHFIAKRMKLEHPEKLDHKDLNPLNNQRSNLRAATNSQNGANCRIRGHNTSGVKGVSWYEPSQKWCAKIRVDGNLKHLGYFDTMDAAITAYNEARLKHFGEFA